MVIMDGAGMKRVFTRLAHEIDERNEGLDGVVLIGIKRGGEVVARRVADCMERFSGRTVPCAGIDIGITRDDLVSAFFVPDAEKNEIGFSITGKTVVLCDDVLHTGRSAVAGIEALFRLGRPKKIQLLILIDRGGRELPVRADFTGKNVPAAKAEYIDVKFLELDAKEDGVTLEKRKI